MAVLHYSPYAFAHPMLEAAFQSSWHQQVGRYMWGCLIMAWSLCFALTHRMYRHLGAMQYTFPYHVPLHFWLPAAVGVLGTGIVSLSVCMPKLYQKNWSLWTLAVRLLLTCAVLETWRFMPPEPALGTLTLGTALLNFGVVGTAQLAALNPKPQCPFCAWP
jgi:hypothetical protein